MWEYLQWTDSSGYANFFDVIKDVCIANFLEISKTVWKTPLKGALRGDLANLRMTIM